MAQDIENDPIVQAQEQIETSLIEINFKNLKSLESTIKYASNLVIKTKGTGGVSFLATAQMDLEKISIDIPFGVISTKEAKEINEDYQKSKLEVVENFKTKLLEDSNDNNLITLKQNTDKEELENQKAIKDENILIKKITFTSKNSNQELQNVLRNSKNLNDDDKESQIVIKVNKKKNNNKINDVVSLNDIESIRNSRVTENQKTDILNKAKEQKKFKLQKENERFVSVGQKEFKDKNIKESKERQKAKKQEIELKLSKGQLQKKDISNQDIYELGEESLSLGLKIDTSKFEKENQTQKENDKIQFEIEKKNDPILNKIFSSIFSSLVGTVQASAFSPGIYSDALNYSTNGYHINTTADVFNGSTANGSTLGLWFKGYVNGTLQSNQSISLYNDDTIRVSGKCFDMSDYGKINNGQNANGVKVHLWDCNNGSSQKWVYDDEGRIRLKNANSYCLDTDNGSANKTFYVWQCGSWTERYRGGDYEMKLIAERGTPYGNSLDVGHSWVTVQKINSNNFVSENTTYGLWPQTDIKCGIGFADNCNDSTIGTIQVNLQGTANSSLSLYDENPDYNWAIDLHEKFPYNWTAKAQDRGIFKVKNISKYYADLIRLNGGYKISAFTSNQALINSLTFNMQNSSNWNWFAYYLPLYTLDFVIKAFLFATGITNAYSTNYNYFLANCTSYAMNLWSNYGGVSNYNSLYWGALPLPNELYNSMKNSIYVY